MQILRFLWKESKTHLGKSVGLFITILLLGVLLMVLYFLYKTTVSAIQYYSSASIVDTKRIEITADSNLLTLFSGGKSGISKKDTDTLLLDSRLEKPEIFTLIEYPVTAKFSLFSFGLETDIPVFAISGGTLQSDEIGISRKMLDYYNSQFAGSSSVFPQIGEKFLIGQPVTLTVGESKLFHLENTPGTAFGAKISSIHSDYPGFGIVLREDLMKEKLQEVGQKLGNPYKIVLYMKDSKDKEALIQKYRHLNLVFDSDKIEELQKKLDTVRILFIIIMIFISGIILLIIIFLLAGIFREMAGKYRILNVFGIYEIKSILLTIGEPIIIIGMSIGILGFLFSLFSGIITGYLSDFLSKNGIIFPIYQISVMEGVLILSCIFLFLIAILLGLHMKNKQRI